MAVIMLVIQQIEKWKCKVLNLLFRIYLFNDNSKENYLSILWTKSKTVVMQIGDIFKLLVLINGNLWWNLSEVRQFSIYFLIYSLLPQMYEFEDETRYW